MDEDLSTLRGSVTFEGQPVKVGSVNFYTKQLGVGATAKLDENGEFAIEGDLHPGEYLVFLSPPKPAMPIMDDANHPTPLKLDLKGYPKIPANYRSQALTDLLVKVDVGENVLAIEVPSK